MPQYMYVCVCMCPSPHTHTHTNYRGLCNGLSTCTIKAATWWLALAASQIRGNPAQCPQAHIFKFPHNGNVCLPSITIKEKNLKISKHEIKKKNTAARQKTEKELFKQKYIFLIFFFLKIKDSGVCVHISCCVSSSMLHQICFLLFVSSFLKRAKHKNMSLLQGVRVTNSMFHTND